MKMLSVKIMILLVIGVSILPFISSSSPNDMYEDQVAVIMYHHLSDTAKSNVTITPKLFKQQLEYLIISSLWTSSSITWLAARSLIMLYL